MCKYCDNMPTEHEGFYIEYYNQPVPDEVYDVQVEAKYCPNCGRKLIDNSSKEKNDRKLVDRNILIALTTPYEHDFRCSCGCNVFSKYIEDDGKEIFVCHGCDKEYI